MCSFPGCWALTIGPSRERPEAVNSCGTACHIAAASPGKLARRYDETMTREERKGFANGIWMCASHGRLIDGDERRFTVDVLRRWKANAEARAERLLSKPERGAQAVSLTFADLFAVAEAQQLLADEGLEDSVSFSVTLSSSAVAVYEELTIMYSGVPSETLVDLRLWTQTGAVDLYRFRVGPTGDEGSVTVRIPFLGSTSPQEALLEFGAELGRRVLAVAVRGMPRQPSMSVSPNRGRPGDAVDVKVEGFPPYEVVRLFVWQGHQGVQVAEAQSGGDGQAQISFARCCLLRTR